MNTVTTRQEIETYVDADDLLDSDLESVAGGVVTGINPLAGSNIAAPSTGDIQVSGGITVTSTTAATSPTAASPAISVSPADVLKGVGLTGNAQQDAVIQQMRYDARKGTFTPIVSSNTSGISAAIAQAAANPTAMNAIGGGSTK
jgi:hypothetical protein